MFENKGWLGEEIYIENGYGQCCQGAALGNKSNSDPFKRDSIWSGTSLCLSIQQQTWEHKELVHIGQKKKKENFHVL